MERQSPRKPYPTDVSDEEWAFVVPSLALMTPDAPQRRHDLREVVNALRWIVRAGSPWRLLPTTFPPWAAVYQQTRRWLAAGVFAAMAHDLRMLLREAAARMPQPRAVIRDSRTVQSTPESGAGAGIVDPGGSADQQAFLFADGTVAILPDAQGVDVNRAADLNEMGQVVAPVRSGQPPCGRGWPCLCV